MNIQVATLITIISAALFCGGFYYTTQLRLDSLEEDVQSLSKKLKNFPKKNRSKSRDKNRGEGR